MSALPESFRPGPVTISPEDYLAAERSAGERHEYYAGEVYAMAGGTRNHSRIILNLGGEIRQGLKGSPCEAFSNETKVRSQFFSNEQVLYSYPDLSVVYGDAEFADDKEDVLLNPVAIFEELSPTTEAYNRGSKFRAYRTIPTLQEYVLVDQSKPPVEIYRREPSGWLLTTYEGLDTTAKFTSFGLTLPLAEIYDRVDWTIE